jgi:hypothetical protein
MCDPTIMAIASMASGLADFAGQQSAQAKQKQSYDEWFAMQEKNRKDQNAKQEQSRQQAEAAQQAAVQGVSAGAQTAAQGAEANRLNDYLSNQTPLTATPASGTPTAGTDTSIADKYMLSSQRLSDDPTFHADLAGKLNAAAQEAKKRIAALATVSSYNGSSGGLDNYVADIFGKSGLTIDQMNERRRGDLAVYGTQQAVNPVQWSYTPGLKIG